MPKLGWCLVSRFATLDTQFRHAIQGRDHYSCQYPYCQRGAPYPPRLEVSHFIRCGHLNTRWDLENADLLCAACHRELGTLRLKRYRAWKRKQLGRGAYVALVDRGKQIVKFRDIESRVRVEIRELKEAA